MNFKKPADHLLPFFTIAILLTTVFVGFTNAQDRARVVTQSTSRPTTPIETTQTPNRVRRTVLTNRIVVTEEKPQNNNLVNKTASSRLTNSPVTINKKSSYLTSVTRSMMIRSIQSKIGIRYRLGTQGPYTYDCSGFVWKVFQESGFNFTRTSAREFWRTFEPVYGDDRFEFGTLVFLNKLGHIGIVADKEGFYHASSSKGITYSKFAGYWSKRIVGFRRVPVSDYSDWNPDYQEDEEN